MSEKAPKVYAPGSARSHVFADGKEVINLGFPVEKLIAFAQQHVNGRGYLNLKVERREKPGQFGDTHSVTLDTYEPKPKASAMEDERTIDRPAQMAPVTDDDIPF